MISPIADERLTDCMVETFRVHKKHASRFQFDPGRIGEPYVVYKITKEKLERLL